MENMSTQEFSKIYDKYKDLLYRIAFTYVKNKDDAEDILQEVFIKRMYKAPKFESDEHEKRWLIRIAVNLSKNHLKSFWNKNKSSFEDVIQSQDVGYWDLNLEEKALLEEVMKLPEKIKIVLYLHYYECYSCSEIAEITNRSLSAVKMQLKKGRELLKFSLEVE